MLKVLGKSVSEFLNGLDNLHAYLRSRLEAYIHLEGYGDIVIIKS